MIISAQIRKKFPNRVPVIVTPLSDKTPPITKSKFLVPDEMTMGQFLHTLRKYIPTLLEEQAIFLFHNNRAVRTSSMVSELFPDNDDVLRIKFSLENCFGGGGFFTKRFITPITQQVGQVTCDIYKRVGLTIGSTGFVFIVMWFVIGMCYIKSGQDTYSKRLYESITYSTLAALPVLVYMWIRLLHVPLLRLCPTATMSF